MFPLKICVPVNPLWDHHMFQSCGLEVGKSMFPLKICVQLILFGTTTCFKVVVGGKQEHVSIKDLCSS